MNVVEPGRPACEVGAELRSDPAALQAHVCNALQRYGLDNAVIRRLPIVKAPFPGRACALELVMIEVPSWAQHCAIDGCLAVPVEATTGQGSLEWGNVDWFLAIFLLLECWHERQWELEHGSVHSYSRRLKGWDDRVWSRAWVNRIALFLRAWASRQEGVDEQSLLGARPSASVLMTHDVDAVDKTLAIRCKQSLFLAFNACRLAGRGEWQSAMSRAVQAFAFFFSSDDWSQALPSLCALERCRGLRSRFHFYAGGRPTSPLQWLFDPGYALSDVAVAQALQSMLAEGLSVGLHPSYHAWRSTPLARAQRHRLEAAVGTPVVSCRQHWLRFSWSETWATQAQAGLTEDTTLMFNDRPGFRSAAALAWNPWNPGSPTLHPVSALPTVLMDSHLYDYQQLVPEERRQSIAYWLDEIVAVGGQAAVLWHPHTLTRDYGWKDGFIELMDHMKRRSLCIAS